jgi:hypothetical protein
VLSSHAKLRSEVVPKLEDSQPKQLAPFERDRTILAPEPRKKPWAWLLRLLDGVSEQPSEPEWPESREVTECFGHEGRGDRPRTRPSGGPTCPSGRRSDPAPPAVLVRFR